MVGLRQLDGGDEYPQERVVLLASDTVRPVVEVHQGNPMIVHVVEPVAVHGDRFTLDELTDVEVGDSESGVAYALRRLTPDAPWTLVPTVDAQGLVLRVELGRPGGVALLDDDGLLAEAMRPPNPPPPVVAYEHRQVVTAAVWLIEHGLGYDPAAVRVVESFDAADGTSTEPDRVLYPVPGAVVELHFGTSDNPIPITGIARLS